MISVHTSPFAQLGGRDTGGMNVYVRELSRHLADRGVQVDIFTRRTDRRSPHITNVYDGVRLINVEAGPAEPVDKDALFCALPEFASEMPTWRFRRGSDTTSCTPIIGSPAGRPICSRAIGTCRW